MERIKNHYKTILSSLLTLVLVCSMVFLIPSHKSYAYENTSTVQDIYPLETFLRVYDISIGDYIIYPSNSSGVAVFSYSENNTPYIPDYGFSTVLDLPSDYGVNKIFTISLSLLFDISQNGYFKAFEYQNFSFSVNNTNFTQSSPQVSNVSFISSGDVSQPYEVTISFDFDATSLNLSENVEFAFFLLGSGLEYTPPEGFYIQTTFKSGSLNIDYSVKTSGDVANEKLDNISSDLNDIRDDLMNPTTDIPVNDSQLSDDADRFNSAVDDYLSVEESINQSIQSIYDSYENDSGRYGSLLTGLVANVKDIANSNVFSACWTFVKGYPLIYWLINMAITLCVMAFLLRR